MKQYRKYISMLFILIISCMVFTGCTKKDNEDSQMNSATVETATAAKSENADTVEPEDQNGVKTTEGSDDQEAPADLTKKMR